MSNHVNYYASRDKAKTAASKLGGKFQDNGADAGEQRWAVVLKQEATTVSVTTSQKTTANSERGRKGTPVTMDGQTFRSKADAAKFVIREIVSEDIEGAKAKNKAISSKIHKQLMERVGLTVAGARTYQNNHKKWIIHELETERAANAQ